MEQLNENSSFKEQNGEKEKNNKKFDFLRMIKANRRVVVVVVSLLIAIISATFVSKYTSSAKMHSEIIAVLQAKQDRVLQLSAASTGIAAGAALALGDRATAVSNKLLDLTGYFIIILSAILLEKYLVTVMGLISFKYLIPISCIIFSVFTIVDNKGMRKMAVRLAVFAIISFLIIPISVGISNVIENTYETSINSTLESSKMIADELDNINESISNESESNDTREQNEIESSNIFSSIGGLVNAAKDKFVGAVKNVAKKAKEMINKLTIELNKMIDAIAVMMVTTCIIPILVIVFFFWVVKLLFEVNINLDLKKAPKFSSFKK